MRHDLLGISCLYIMTDCSRHIFTYLKDFCSRLTNIIVFFRVDEIDFDGKDIGSLVQVQAEILQDGDYFDKWRLFWVG